MELTQIGSDILIFAATVISGIIGFFLTRSMMLFSKVAEQSLQFMSSQNVLNGNFTEQLKEISDTLRHFVETQTIETNKLHTRLSVLESSHEYHHNQTRGK